MKLASWPTAGCRPGGVGTSAGVVLACLLLASCTKVEIEDHSLQYNEASGSLVADDIRSDCQSRHESLIQKHHSSFHD